MECEMRQTALILITLLISVITSLPVLAAWQLDNDKSRLTFMSVKKATIAENHHFSKLEGHIDANAQVNINVDLASVNTNIAIRDERMKQFVFESDKYASATFNAQLDNAMLKALKAGDMKQLTVDGQLDFHGQKQAISMHVNVIKLIENKISVHTSQPFFIKADAFGVVAGINKLKELAALPSIDYVVPVSFSVTFVR